MNRQTFLDPLSVLSLRVGDFLPMLNYNNCFFVDDSHNRARVTVAHDIVGGGHPDNRRAYVRLVFIPVKLASWFLILMFFVHTTGIR